MGLQRWRTLSPPTPPGISTARSHRPGCFLHVVTQRSAFVSASARMTGSFPLHAMMKHALAAAVTVSTVLTVVPAITLADESSGSSVSSSSQSSSVDSATGIRIERCKRFARGDDYVRCVRLIQRLPERSSASSSSSATSQTDLDWKWMNILNRLEEKLGSTVKFVAVMGKQFCKDRTDDNTKTSSQCMSRLGDELQLRMTRLINIAFRGDLPSSR